MHKKEQQLWTEFVTDADLPGVPSDRLRQGKGILTKSSSFWLKIPTKLDSSTWTNNESTNIVTSEVVFGDSFEALEHFSGSFTSTYKQT